MNDGEGPEKPYHPMPPHTNMTNLSACVHIQLPAKSDTSGDRYSYLSDLSSSVAYESVSEDDRDTSQEAKLHVVLQNEEGSNDVLDVLNRSDLEFCKISGMRNVTKNTAELESKISNEDYVYIPESVEKSSPDQHYDYVPTEGVTSSPEDSPKVTN